MNLYKVVTFKVKPHVTMIITPGLSAALQFSEDKMQTVPQLWGEPLCRAEFYTPSDLPPPCARGMRTTHGAFGENTVTQKGMQQAPTVIFRVVGKDVCVEGKNQ